MSEIPAADKSKPSKSVGYYVGRYYMVMTGISMISYGLFWPFSGGWSSNVSPSLYLGVCLPLLSIGFYILYRQAN
ncbi:MAG: hypothetical protein ACXAAO_07820 [Candidatus Thorarchaeota archaeon]|jgi:hypothetical protein